MTVDNLCVLQADYAAENHNIPEKIRYAKLYAIKWHCAMGVAMAAGLLALRTIPDIPYLPTAFLKGLL